jgi:hypothetical protein
MRSTILCAVVFFAATSSRLKADDPAAAALPYAVPSAGRTSEASSYGASSSSIASPRNFKSAEALINCPPSPTTDESERVKAALAKLDALQREIDKLRQELTQRETTQQQLSISLKCIEINLTKRDDFGFDYVGMKKLDGPSWSMLEQTYAGVLEALLQNDIAKVVAEPTIIAKIGREASFMSGGEIPVPASSGQVEYKPYGTRVKLLGIVTPEKRIRLELRMENTDIDGSEMIVDGKRYPGLRRRIVDTGVEIAPGETLVLHGPAETRQQEITRDDGKTEKSTVRIEQLWLVKASFCDPVDTHDVITRSAKAKPRTKAAR